jgi:hypothetical protein
MIHVHSLKPPKLFHALAVFGLWLLLLDAQHHASVQPPESASSSSQASRAPLAWRSQEPAPVGPSSPPSTCIQYVADPLRLTSSSGVQAFAFASD